LKFYLLEFDESSIESASTLNTGPINLTAGSTFVFIVEDANGQRISDIQSISSSWGSEERRYLTLAFTFIMKLKGYVLRI